VVKWSGVISGGFSCISSSGRCVARQPAGTDRLFPCITSPGLVVDRLARCMPGLAMTACLARGPHLIIRWSLLLPSACVAVRTQSSGQVGGLFNAYWIADVVGGDVGQHPPWDAKSWEGPEYSVVGIHVAGCSSEKCWETQACWDTKVNRSNVEAVATALDK
jgi:hypothetical protein